MDKMSNNNNNLSQNFAQDVLTARLYSDNKGKGAKLGTSSSAIRLNGTTTSNVTNNRLKPKSMLGSASMPSLLSKKNIKGNTNTSNINDDSNMESKNDLNINDTLGLGINIVSTKTLLSSKSGASLIGATTSRFLSSSSSNYGDNGKSSSPSIIPYSLDFNNDMDEKSETNSPGRMSAVEKIQHLVNLSIASHDHRLDKYETFLESLNLSKIETTDLNSVPQTFFYLRQKNRDTSVYELEKCGQNQVAKDNYSTISKEGVTQYRGKYSEFTSMDQWEREFQLYHKICQIRFFRQYRVWKAFMSWSKGLRRKNVLASRESIGSKHFFFIPPLRDALLKVRSMCVDLAAEGMLDVRDGYIFPLQEFLEAQIAVHDGLKDKFEGLSTEMLLTVRTACDIVVDEFLKANNIVANHKMTFMERASLRSECRGLTRFLRLVDIMTGDFLRTMIQEMIIDLAAIASSDTLEPRVVTDDDITDIDLTLQRRENKLKTPVFRLTVLMNEDDSSDLDNNNGLDLTAVAQEELHGIPSENVHSGGDKVEENEIPDPTVDENKDNSGNEDEGTTLPVDQIDNNQNRLVKNIRVEPSQDDLVKSLDIIINSSMQVVEALGTVYDSPDTEMFVMPDGDGDDEEGVETQDVVAAIKSSPIFINNRQKMTRSFKHAYAAVRKYIGVFEPFRDTYISNKKYQNDVSLTFSEGSIDAFINSIKFYKDQIAEFDECPRFADVGVLLVDSSDLKKGLTPSPVNCLKAIQEFLPQLSTQRAKALLDELGSMNPIIGGDPTSVDAYVLKKKTRDAANSKLEAFKEEQSYIRQLSIIMDDNDWPLPDNVKALSRMLREALPLLETNIATAEGKEEEETKKFSQQVMDDVPKLFKSIQNVREDLDHAQISDPEAEDSKVIKFLAGKSSEFSRHKASAEKLQEYQAILKLNVEDFELLDEVGADLNLKVKLWNDKAAWNEMRSIALNTRMADVDVAQLERDLTRFNRTTFLASKGLPSNKVVDKFRASVDEFNPVLPVITNLRNDTLKARHWDMIHNAVGVTINGEDDFTVQDLISKNITVHEHDIATIATSAQQESILEEMMAKVIKIWETTDFIVMPYKDIKDLYVLGDTSEVIQNLDDSLVTINTVLGSRYVSGIRDFVDLWRSKLMHFQETMDEWLTCQRNWMYLETIFGSPDIIRQLPGPAKTFQAVDKSFKFIMKQTNDEPNALLATTKDKTRRDVFRSHNTNLEQIQKDLEDYLETKRMAFPRFYFLSNDELLEILSQAKEPRAVQPHMRKCFDNLIKLEFGKEEGSVDLLAMFSGEGERVSLGKNLKARGNVEEWLTSVEKRMKETLHIAMKFGLHDYDEQVREEWILLHPGQIVATVAQMTWARDTEAALSKDDPIQGMLDWSAMYKKELLKLIVKIRGNLSKLHRKIIVALVTTDVHARDIIDELCERQVTSKVDFLWQQQLRYYWDGPTDDCLINHSDAKVKYGYEYMGATSRLVITPLTDRCWLTLTGSYALKLGAAPAGPAGTGKTESSKDLAKAIGIQCVVFNCSDQIDYKMMGKLFRGLAQGGSWVCLDEFNRIDIEVLSVIAQQLLVLREGRITQKPIINFMGITIPLFDHHVIITMNPGYAGRTELPDNLQVCFRPVSMMVPNYALIAEIMLFAEGFGDAKNLSRKMCKLYILCSEQLSQQPHYDYGLRAVKSVLVMAGGLKRSNPELDEDSVLIRALRDSNVPKFLAEDLPLFAAIVQDLFPGVEIPSNDYGELQVALEEEIVKAGLQKVPKFIGKVIQMFDIFNIRFGATLVGPAGTGKTSCYRILANLMSNLREKGSSNSEFQKVRFRVLNPKCITMGELYGEFHPLTQEWHDGLASSIMREYVAEESDDKRWTIFDGPIDALWIENMNTVLDDNMTLCLANGQRIKLKVEMKCLFEVNDLAVASPATVSRIGVVYMTPSDLGWFPFVQSWVVRDLHEECPPWVQVRLLELFEKTLFKGLAWHRKFGKEPVDTVDIQIIISICTLFQSLWTPDNNVDFTKPEAELKLVLDKLFFFSYVWALGGTLNYSLWEEYTEYTRELFDEVSPSLGLPPTGTAFDYYVDVSECAFKDWKEMVESFTFDPTLPYFSLVVPTMDTCRYSYVMKKLITVNKPVFITGVTGTGKTVCVQTLLNSNQEMPYDGGMGLLPIFLNFSAQTQSIVVQGTIESKLEKKRKNLLGAPAGRKVVAFVDDVNMPMVETYGAQAPVELLRQFLDFKGFYDRDKLFWKEIQDMLLFVGAAPPGGGRAVVTPRFTRHFNVICMPPASDHSLSMIFESILGGFLSIKFENEVLKMSEGVVAATIEMYTKISEELLPTPSKFHYTFNLRDISKVFQGILMIRPRKCQDSTTFARLWVHECQRIFYDRLVNTHDHAWFKKASVDLVARHLKLSLSDEDLFEKPIVFADFIKPDADPKFYEDIRDLNKLTAVLDDQLDTYNVTFPTQMNLVFFTDALTHTARIIRILRQPRGNAMLIGVGGSGKQSLTKIASFVAGYDCASIEINRGYGISNFREDIKVFMIKAGVEGKHNVFLFTDSQIVDETMLEDLNNVLNTGEIPNLFPQDEIDKICSDMIPVCQEDGITETRDNCLSHFVSRVRDRLHIVLCMSPVGDALRIRCRQFPSLINCTTIDWFHGWPEEALMSVAKRLLGDLELPNDEIRSGVVSMCGFVHKSIEAYSDKFFEELRRRVYTTPKSYLDLIALYMSMLNGLQGTVEVQQDRMKIGVGKLDDTNSIVDGLKAELEKLQPVLIEKSKETDELLANTEVESSAAKIIADKVGADEAVVGKQAAETQAVADDAQKDLDRAMPALEAAVSALNSLSKNDITEVKSFANPPKAVQIVLEAVCVLLGEDTDWKNAKAVMSKSDFLETLQKYDKDNIPESRLKILRKKYVNAEEMQPDVIAKVSKAGTGLCLWARAMDVYADVAKEVEPKKARLAAMKAELDEANSLLAVKQAELKEVMDKVNALQKLCEETLAEKNRLQAESDLTANRLIRAEKLTGGLQSEGVRWRQNIIDLAKERIDLIGDCFLSCACISYYGGFTGTFRDVMVQEWLNRAREFNIPCGDKFALSKTLGNPVQIREWQNQGLPTDPVSVNNGILVDKCRRWPLMIDPQQQANKWIRKMEEDSLQITSMSDINLLRTLENCIRVGKSLLIEEIGELIEPALEPVLQKAIFKQGTRRLIRLGDSDVDYDDNFKLYMTTKLPNPHYLPEVCIKVTLINFTVTMEGLEAQLLGDVVAHERPDIEEKKIQLLLQMADDKRQLAALEAKILQMLSESEGNILDDEALINTLAESKVTSTAIAERVAEAEITEGEINDARSKYLSIATRGSIIYFVVADLAMIDPMYQYSLGYYNKLFNRCLADSEKDNNLEIRLQNILSYTTMIIYENICRGLFERHKLVLSSMICFQILRQTKEIHEIEWNIFMRGAGAIDKSALPTNPDPEKISEPQWLVAYAAELLEYSEPTVDDNKDTKNEDNLDTDDDDDTMKGPPLHAFSSPTPFKGLTSHITKELSGEWRKWSERTDLMNTPLPEGFENVNLFQRLLLVKALREDKLQQSVALFVAKKLGEKFSQSPTATMDEIYKDLDNKTPCIFILSKGADPTGMLLRFARSAGWGDRLHIVSLGQGQGPVAKKLIDEGCKSGDWVVLQNCMLAKSWMPSLDQIIFQLQEKASQPGGGGIHSDFRLYLTSSPATYFPVSVLQNGVKMTNEPPKGFRANILRSFQTLIKPDEFENCKKQNEFKKLLTGLCFFHANIQERRKFGPLGWNILYAFDESDLETSIAVLRRFLEEQEVIPWDALNFVTGHINYGGRVTDDWDRRCLMAMLSIYMVPEILTENYKFSRSGKYFAPPATSYEENVAVLQRLPTSDDPEVFGMHENANVTFNRQESLGMMDTLLSLQPRASGGAAGKSPDEMVIDLADSFEEQLPKILDHDEAGPTTFVIQANGLLPSLAICLEQEMIKFNRLMNKCSSSLRDIKRAIRGMIVMSADLDAMYTSFLNNKLPPIWEKVSFASLKTLGSWFADTIYRIAFMRTWLVNGQPAAFPLPVFFFPQGFMTASLQTYARKYLAAIDGLTFKFEIKHEAPEEIKEGPEDGVFIYGLFLEGARFDRASSVVSDSVPGKMYDLLPMIHFQPAEGHKQPMNTYACPVYKTAVRKGVLSTTGMSTNFVVAVELPSDLPEQKWILGGVASLCNLTD